MISIECEMCKNIHQITKDTYNKRIRQNRKHICSNCMKEYKSQQWENKTDDEKKMIKTKMSNSHKNMNESEKIKVKEQSSTGLKKYWEMVKSGKIKRGYNRKPLSDETKLKMSKSRKSWWEKRTPEQLIEISERGRYYARKQWDSMSDENKEFYSNMAKKVFGNYWNTISEEDRLAVFQKISDKKLQYWKDIDSFQKDKRLAILQEGHDKWNQSLTIEELDEYYFKIANGIMNSENVYPNPTELLFMNILDKNIFKYKRLYVNQTKDKDFYKTFGVLFSPYHLWDFKIHTKDKNILIDVDGSIHNLTIGKHIIQGIDIGLKIKLNDDKRPYQTDGLEAYIIEAYNDKLENGTKVLNLKSGEYITLNELIEYLTVLDADMSLLK